jgi:hypothetical protein
VILRLTCPICNKDAYESAVEDFSPCPHCGILFSGLHGRDRRGASRIKKEISFVFPNNGESLEARTVNVSERGLCVKIFGKLSLSSGDSLNLHVNGANVQAQTIWAKGNDDGVVTMLGLQLLEGFGIY